MICNTLHAGGPGWLWGGCSDNVDFGEKISKQYVDAQETGQDPRAAVNLHNNAAGRLVSCLHIYIYVCLRIYNLISEFEIFSNN